MLDDFWKDMEEGWAWGGISVRRSRGTYYPPVNIYETNDKYIVLMELPGINPDLVKLEYESGHLKIHGKRVDPVCGENTRYHALEIHFGEFERVIKFGGDIEPEGIRTVYSNGFLRVELPKKKKKVITLEIEEE